MHSYRESAVVVDITECVSIKRTNAFFQNRKYWFGFYKVRSLFVVNKGKCQRLVVFLGFLNEWLIA